MDAFHDVLDLRSCFRLKCLQELLLVIDSILLSWYVKIKFECPSNTICKCTSSRKRQFWWLARDRVRSGAKLGLLFESTIGVQLEFLNESGINGLETVSTTAQNKVDIYFKWLDLLNAKLYGLRWNWCFALCSQSQGKNGFALVKASSMLW